MSEAFDYNLRSLPADRRTKTGNIAAAGAPATAAAAENACSVASSENCCTSPLMSPGATETLLSGEAAANILLPASAAKMRAEKEGIASAVPSSKYRIKRKIIPSDGDRTAQKAKAEQQTQRDASVPRLAFETAEKLPGAIGVPQQQVPAARELLEQHANGMQISGEEEQPAAEQDAIQMEASAVNQQQDTAAPKILQPVHQAEEPSVGDMAGQW